MSEWGATDDLESIERVAAEADAHMMSWQEWRYCDCADPTTTGEGEEAQALVIDPSKPSRGDNLERDKLKIVARPYPQKVNGTPTGWSFDPRSGRFELTYETAAVGGGEIPRRVKTQIMIPPVAPSARSG